MDESKSDIPQPKVEEGWEHEYGTAKTPEQEAAWKKLGDTCDSKLSEFAPDVTQVSLKTDTGEGYEVQRLILKDPNHDLGSQNPFFVIEKILPTQGLPDSEFVNSIHITKVTPLGKFHIEEGYRRDKDGVVRRIVGDTIVPETVKQLISNIKYTRTGLSTRSGSTQTNMLTEAISRSTPSSELPKSLKFTGRLSDEEQDRLTQEEDDDWFEAQREHFRQREDPEPYIVPNEPWRKEVMDKAIEIAKNDGGRAPEEADFNTAILTVNAVPKEIKEELKRDLKAIEEGRSSGNSE